MKKRGALLFVLMLCLLFTAVASAQEDDVLVDCDHPRVVYLANKTEVNCLVIVELHNSGIGFGQILKATVVAEGLEEYDVDWQALLEEYRVDIGWGGIARAFGLAERYPDLEVTGRDLLDLKLGGLGWGQIRKAQAIADELGIDFAEAVTMVESGEEWEGEGPPPWAKGGKDKDKENGPPEWANNDKDKDKGKENGPPDWANNDKDEGESGD
jgi:hypothetical protein